MQNTYVENKELSSRLDELAQLKADVQTLTEENNELRDILDKKDSLSDYKPDSSNGHWSESRSLG